MAAIPNFTYAAARRRPEYVDAVYCGPQGAGTRQTIIPFDVDFQPSARAKPGDFAVVPGRRQGGEKLQFAGFALDQHLGDRGRSSEVAIDLKRRVIVEQVGQRGAGQQRSQILISLLAIGQPCPEVDDPRT